MHITILLFLIGFRALIIASLCRSYVSWRSHDKFTEGSYYDNKNQEIYCKSERLILSPAFTIYYSICKKVHILIKSLKSLACHLICKFLFAAILLRMI